MLQQLLKSFHLDAKERVIVEKLIELGPQAASAIARLCELPRNTVRGILDKLVGRGLLVKTNRANTQYYSIEDKEQLVLSLRHQQRALNAEIEERISMVEAYGHELTQNTRAGSRPKITFYEGLSGLQKVYEDTLTSKTGLKSWGSYDANKIALPSYFRTYYMRRAKKGVAMKSIHPDTPLSREHQARDGQELRESALVPQDRLNFTPEIQIYGDKINIVSWKEKLGIIIQSAEIADAMNSIFEFCFDAAKKYGRATKLKGKKGRK